MLRRLLCLSLLISAFGCGEDEKDPNQPQITAATATCRSVSLGTGQAFLLQEVVFTVQDLDGVEDLGEPVVVAEATRLEGFEIEDLTWENTEEDCATDACQRRYTWIRSSDAAQIYCGEDEVDLDLDLTIKDAAGFPYTAKVSATEI